MNSIAFFALGCQYPNKKSPVRRAGELTSEMERMNVGRYLVGA